MQKKKYIEVPVSLWADMVKFFALPDEDADEHGKRAERIQEGIGAKMNAMLRSEEYAKERGWSRKVRPER